MAINGPLWLQCKQRWTHSAAVHGNFIYSIGGLDNWVEKSTLASVERYNINSNSWESVASLGSSRHYHASVTCGDSIFCIGGRSNGSVTNIVEKYDVKSNQWSSDHCPKRPWSCCIQRVHLCNWRRKWWLSGNCGEVQHFDQSMVCSFFHDHKST